MAKRRAPVDESPSELELSGFTWSMVFEEAHVSLDTELAKQCVDTTVTGRCSQGSRGKNGRIGIATGHSGVIASSSPTVTFVQFFLTHTLCGSVTNNNHQWRFYSTDDFRHV